MSADSGLVNVRPRGYLVDGWSLIPRAEAVVRLRPMHFAPEPLAYQAGQGRMTRNVWGALHFGGSMTSEKRVPATWTDDCSGKKDFDGEIIAISTRYWPQGGGFHIYDGVNFYQNTKGSPPSAKSSFLLRASPDEDGSDEPTTLVSKKFEGDSFESVRAQVEEWAEGQYVRIVSALLREFLPGPK